MATKGRGLFYEHAPLAQQFEGEPNDRHLRMMEFIHLHGMASAETLFAREHQLDGMSYDSFKDSIKRLWRMRDVVGYKEGYVCRPYKQRKADNANYNCYVYDLTDKGREYLSKKGRLAEVLRPTGPWEHQLFVATITGTMHVLCEKYGYRYIPPHEYASSFLFHAEFEWKIYEDKIAVGKQTISRPLVPDSIFAIDYGNNSFIAYAVEADRGTEPIRAKDPDRRSVLRMVRQYHDLIDRKKYKAAYGREAQLVLLFETIDEARAREFIELVKTEANGSIYMAAQWVPEYGEMFKPTGLLTHLFEEGHLRAKTKKVMAKFRNKKTGEIVERPKEVMDTWTIRKT